MHTHTDTHHNLRLHLLLQRTTLYDVIGDAVITQPDVQRGYGVLLTYSLPGALLPIAQNGHCVCFNVCPCVCLCVCGLTLYMCMCVLCVCAPSLCTRTHCTHRNTHTHSHTHFLSQDAQSLTKVLFLQFNSYPFWDAPIRDVLR